MEREMPDGEAAGATAGDIHDAALSSEAEEVEHLRAQRLQSLLLLHQRRMLVMSLDFSKVRLLRDLGTAFRHSVGLRFMAIRQRYRASAARLLLPGEPSD